VSRWEEVRVCGEQHIPPFFRLAQQARNDLEVPPHECGNYQVRIDEAQDVEFNTLWASTNFQRIAAGMRRHGNRGAKLSKRFAPEVHRKCR
jgi:hypothetical protein